MTWLMAIPGAFKLVPRWLWEAIGVGLLIAAALHWYHGRIAAAEKRGSDVAYANVAKQARELADKANALNRSLADKIRSRTDEALADNARAADAVLVRGPGKATCPAITGISSTAGGHNQAAAKADASVDPVPSGERIDLIALPFAPTVIGAKDHDALLIEAKAWRDWYSTFSARWQAWQKEAEKARATPAP